MGRVIRLASWVLLLATLLTVAAAVGAVPADSTGPVEDPGDGLHITRSTLRQSGNELALRIRTDAPLPVKRLGGGWDRGICLALSERSRRSVFCVRPGRGGRPVLRRARRTAGGLAVDPRALGTLRRFGSLLVGRLPLSAGGLRAGALRWWTMSWWPGSECQELECARFFPLQAGSTIGLVEPRSVGCSVHGPWYRNRGGQGRRVVSLTFDDGPSAYTTRVMGVLRKAHARATFYVLGSRIAGRADLLRRMLREGNEIADHSFSHPSLPSFSQIRITSARIRRATGFRPCLFRPPYGNVNGRLVADARRAGMRTINWDVDPRDWSTPGASAIATRVVNHVRPGSIVVMHDGGGNRSQTIAALPTILRRLRQRGYEFLTTTELLGGRLLWRPR